MTVYPTSLDGLCKWVRFSNEDSAFYDSTTKDFHDLSPYSSEANGRIGDFKYVGGGTPTFLTRGTNSRTGLKLDNTCLWDLLWATPYHGSWYFIVSATWVSATINLYPFIFGTNANAATAGNIAFTRASGVERLSIRPMGNGASLHSNTADIVSGDIYMITCRQSQSDRKHVASLDGGTNKREITATASSIQGNAVTLTGGAGATPRQRVMFGNTNNSIADFTDSGSDYLVAFEFGQFTDPDFFTNQSAALLAFQADREAYYDLNQTP